LTKFQITMKKIQYKTVEEYIQSSVTQSQAIMEQIKRLIETTVPNAESCISWNVPIYKLNGILAGFDVAKSHVSFGIDSLNEATRKILETKGYKTGKSTIQIKFNQDVPTTEIIQLIEEQLKLNSK
jgi:uncharacterized protein YdhG (YjbR/CyaY superfamily)